MERTETQTRSDRDNPDELQAESKPGALFAPTSAENAPVKTERLFKKAKRSLKVNAKQDDGSATTKNGLLASACSPTSPTGARLKGASLAFSKNSRRSRNVLAYGRGQPKKGELELELDYHLLRLSRRYHGELNRSSYSDNLKLHKYMCITTDQPDTESNCNPNPTA